MGLQSVGVGHDLRDAVVVAQIDEEQAAVVADAMAPAREPDGFADMRGAERAAGVGTIAMHLGAGFAFENAGKSAWGAGDVKEARPRR